MKKIFLSILLVGLTAYTVEESELFKEFLKRDLLKLTPAQGNAINFLNILKYPTEKIEELEIIDENGNFVLRDSNGNVCMGNSGNSMLRCKNKIGLTTVLYSGDAD